jgi:hypothetical protein
MLGWPRAAGTIRCSRCSASPPSIGQAKPSPVMTGWEAPNRLRAVTRSPILCAPSKYGVHGDTMRKTTFAALWAASIALASGQGFAAEDEKTTGQGAQAKPKPITSSQAAAAEKAEEAARQNQREWWERTQAEAAGTFEQEQRRAWRPLRGLRQSAARIHRSRR